MRLWCAIGEIPGPHGKQQKNLGKSEKDTSYYQNKTPIGTREAQSLTGRIVTLS